MLDLVYTTSSFKHLVQIPHGNQRQQLMTYDFENFALLDNVTIRYVLTYVTEDDLSYALIGASKALQQKIYFNLDEPIVRKIQKRIPSINVNIALIRQARKTLIDALHEINNENYNSVGNKRSEFLNATLDNESLKQELLALPSLDLLTCSYADMYKFWRAVSIIPRKFDISPFPYIRFNFEDEFGRAIVYSDGEPEKQIPHLLEKFTSKLELPSMIVMALATEKKPNDFIEDCKKQFGPLKSAKIKPPTNRPTYGVLSHYGPDMELYFNHLVILFDMVEKDGILALEDLRLEFDSFLSWALSPLVEGYGPENLNIFMTNKKRTLMHEMENKLRITCAAIKAVEQMRSTWFIKNLIHSYVPDLKGFD